MGKMHKLLRSATTPYASRWRAFNQHLFVYCYMMKALLTTILFIGFATIRLSAQDPLTYGEVYDFEVGDVFQYHSYESVPGFANKYQHTIVGKEFTQNQDSIIYTIDKINEYTDPDNMDGIITDTTIILVTTNLDQYIDTFSPNGFVDSVFTSAELFNNRLSMERSDSEYLESGFYEWRKRYTVGLGQVEYYYETGFSPYQTAHTLVYYAKGEEVWGNPLDVFLSTSELESNNISVYPNPVKDNLNFKSNPEAGILKSWNIYSVSGMKVISHESPPREDFLDLSFLDEGAYVITFIFDNSVIRKRIIKK